MASPYWSSDDEFEVEKIVDMRTSTKTEKHEFLIKWKGYAAFTNSWEPGEYLEGCQELVDEFVKSREATERKVVGKRKVTTISSDVDILSDSIEEDSDIQVFPKIASLSSKERSFLEGMTKFQAMLDKIPGAFIRVVNSVNHEPPPPDFVYITKFKYGKGVPEPDSAFLTGCECKPGDCGSSACTCLTQVSSHSHSGHYTKEGGLKIISGKQPFIYECNQSCSCATSGKCQNRVIQAGRKVPLEIFQMGDARGWGVRAINFIPAGTFIDLYYGEIITDDEADNRFHNVYNGDGRSLYLFDLDFSSESGAKADYTIDAFGVGSVSRFFNHSCNPNLLVVPCFIDHIDQSLHFIAFFAIKDIRPDEELCFDYTNEMYKRQNQTGKHRKKVYEKGHIRCLCGSSHCRKFVYPSYL